MIYIGASIQYSCMNNMNQIKTVFAIVGLSIAMLASSFAVTVQATEQKEVLTYNVDIITPDLQYSYQEMSALLDSSKSFEDINGINLITPNNDVYVFANKGSNGNFVKDNILSLVEDSEFYRD